MGNLINGIIIIIMKFALALLGVVAAKTTLFSTNGEIAYVEDEEAVQLGDWHPGQSGTLGAGEYARVVPDRFSADSDDIFMRSMIANYAIDKNCAGKDDPPAPCGKFVMNEATMRAAASEVLCTHKGLCGGQLQTYLD